MTDTPIIAIDPGPVESAYCLLNAPGCPAAWKVPNETLLAVLTQRDAAVVHCVCERIRSYGMPAGAELFETCEWSGRFKQAWLWASLRHEWHWMERRQVKLHLCGSSRAKDANVRQALIDRYGGKEAAIGRKAKPGPLYGFAGDQWAALAVGVTWDGLAQGWR